MRVVVLLTMICLRLTVYLFNETSLALLSDEKTNLKRNSLTLKLLAIHNMHALKIDENFLKLSAHAQRQRPI